MGILLTTILSHQTLCPSGDLTLGKHLVSPLWMYSVKKYIKIGLKPCACSLEMQCSWTRTSVPSSEYSSLPEYFQRKIEHETHFISEMQWSGGYSLTVQWDSSIAVLFHFRNNISGMYLYCVKRGSPEQCTEGNHRYICFCHIWIHSLIQLQIISYLSPWSSHYKIRKGQHDPSHLAKDLGPGRRKGEKNKINPSNQSRSKPNTISSACPSYSCKTQILLFFHRLTEYIAIHIS